MSVRATTLLRHLQYQDPPAMLRVAVASIEAIKRILYSLQTTSITTPRTGFFMKGKPTLLNCRLA